MKKCISLTSLAIFTMLASVGAFQLKMSSSTVETAVNKEAGNKPRIMKDQLNKLWDETVESLVVVRALPYYLLLDSEDRETNEDTPKVSSEEVIDLLKAVL